MQPAKPQISLSIHESLEHVERTVTVKLLTEQHLELSNLNPFKPNGVSHCYQLEQSIFVSIDVGWYFSVYSNFNRTFCKQTEETLIRRRVLRRLVGICIVCLRPTKRTLGFMVQKKAAQTRLSLHLSNCHLVGHHLSLVDFTNWYEYIIRLHDNQSEMCFCLKLLNGTLC